MKILLMIRMNIPMRMKVNIENFGILFLTDAKDNKLNFKQANTLYRTCNTSLPILPTCEHKNTLSVPSRPT